MGFFDFLSKLFGKKSAEVPVKAEEKQPETVQESEPVAAAAEDSASVLPVEESGIDFVSGCGADAAVSDSLPAAVEVYDSSVTEGESDSTELTIAEETDNPVDGLENTPVQESTVPEEPIGAVVLNESEDTAEIAKADFGMPAIKPSVPVVIPANAQFELRKDPPSKDYALIGIICRYPGKNGVVICSNSKTVEKLRLQHANSSSIKIICIDELKTVRPYFVQYIVFYNLPERIEDYKAVIEHFDNVPSKYITMLYSSCDYVIARNRIELSDEPEDEKAFRLVSLGRMRELALGSLPSETADNVQKSKKKDAKSSVQPPEKPKAAKAQPENTDETVSDGPCSGYSFAVTGYVSIFANRKELKHYILTHGGKWAYVGPDLDILVTNDVNTGTRKNQKALLYNIPTISEIEFIKRFGSDLPEAYLKRAGVQVPQVSADNKTAKIEMQTPKETANDYPPLPEEPMGYSCSQENYEDALPDNFREDYQPFDSETTPDSDIDPFVFEDSRNQSSAAAENDVPSPAVSQPAAKTRTEAKPKAPAKSKKAVPESGMNASSFKRIVAFDVETPNNHSNSICQVGLTYIENGKKICITELIDPEAPFDGRCIRVHGITPKKVAGKPNFKSIWPKLEPLFKDNLIVIHNSSFDINVLRKVFAYYGITPPNFWYTCTYKMSKQFHPEREKHKLNYICDEYGIKFNHHDAGSDSDAALQVFNRYIEEGFPVFDWVYKY